MCIADALVYVGNNVQNAGGDTVNPLTDGNKFSAPTLDSLNWMSDADVRPVFNANEPGGGGLTVNDVTLKFYNGDTVIAAINGSFFVSQHDSRQW